MKRLLLLLGVIFTFTSIHAQFIHKIKADSVLITNDSCNAELNLENGTRHIKGFLYNKGNGRTEFRAGVIKLNDSLYLIGSDTLNLVGGIAKRAWLQDGNAFNALGTLGTTDNNELRFITNNIERARFNTTGRLLIGKTVPDTTNAQLQVQGQASFYQGKLYTSNGGYQSSASLRTPEYLSFHTGWNVVGCQALTPTEFVKFRVESSGNSTATNGQYSTSDYCGAIVGFNNSLPINYNLADGRKQTLLITTTGTHGGTVAKQLGGDILIKPNVNGINYSTQFGNADVILQPAGAGKVNIPDKNLLVGGAIGIGTTAPVSRMHVNGTGRFDSVLSTTGRRIGLRSVAAGITLTDLDECIIGDASGGTFNVTLPTAVGRNGQYYTIKKKDNSVNSITINTTSSQTIDGNTTYSLINQWSFVTVIAEAGNWLIIAKS